MSSFVTTTKLSSIFFGDPYIMEGCKYEKIEKLKIMPCACCKNVGLKIG